ncbi:MAG TPA: MFS transporter [Myxococcales bacterium]|nr:MFS transporter [Myxococcales bacterium]HIL81484.1 MFS transporter [Myxococcales bacterium]
MGRPLMTASLLDPEPARPSTHGNLPPRQIAAVTASWIISLFGYYAQAQLLGPIMGDFQQGEEAVGWLFSLENTVLAVSALLCAGPLARWSRARTALVAAAVAVAANFASAFVGSFEALAATRVVAGAAAGVAGAAGVAAAASMREPDRMFATVTLVWGLAGAAEPMAIPFVTVPFGSTGGFLLTGGVCALLLPCLVWLAPPRKTKEAKPSLLTAPNRAIAVIAMLALLVFEIGQGGIYTFIEQIGLRSQMNEYQIGATLTGTGLAGLLGAALAAILGTKFGRRGPIVVGLLLNIVAAMVLATSEDATTYIAMNWLWSAAYYFVVPYTMGAMAALDDLGRWVVSMDAIWTLGDGLGPGIAGSLVERGGYDHLAGLGLFTGLSCMVLMLGVLRNLKFRDNNAHSAKPEEHAPP